MTPYLTADKIINAIGRARKHDSIIDQRILDIKGFSTGVQRRLISNLCELAPVYLEVGAYFGGTACAAINNKAGQVAYLYEDGSQPFGEENVLETLHENLDNTGRGDNSAVWFVQGDFFNEDLDRFDLPIDIFFYDGEHTRLRQGMALPFIFDKMRSTFLYIVDDIDWPDVAAGTCDAFNLLEGERRAMNVIHSWVLTDNKPDGPTWHNGMGLFLCEKL